MFDPLKVQRIGTIRSSRLRLEPLRATHALELFPGFNDPALYEWISTPLPDTVKALADSWTCSADNGPFYWDHNFGLDWALIRLDNNTAIGKFDADFAPDGRVINLGYVLQKNAWGQGFGREAVQSLIAACLDAGVTAIHVYVTKGNVASTRLLEGLGFHAERVLPDNDCIRGKLFDDIEFVLHARG